MIMDMGKVEHEADMAIEMKQTCTTVTMYGMMGRNEQLLDYVYACSLRQRQRSISLLCSSPYASSQCALLLSNSLGSFGSCDS